MEVIKLAFQMTHFTASHSFKIPRLWSPAISSYHQSYHTAERKTPQDLPAQWYSCPTPKQKSLTSPMNSGAQLRNLERGLVYRGL